VVDVEVPVCHFWVFFFSLVGGLSEEGEREIFFVEMEAD
jgi:hypothetical protein